MNKYTKKRGVLSSQTILLYNQLKVIRSHLCQPYLYGSTYHKYYFNLQGSKYEHFRTIHFGINYLLYLIIFFLQWDLIPPHRLVQQFQFHNSTIKIYNFDPQGSKHEHFRTIHLFQCGPCRA